MVLYNPKEWWRLIFAFHQSDTFRRTLPGILGVAIFTGAVAYLENDILKVEFKNSTAIHSSCWFCFVFVVGVQDQYSLRPMVGRKKIVGSSGQRLQEPDYENCFHDR